MAKGLCTFLSKTFWLSLLLGTVSINSHAEELYPWQLAGDYCSKGLRIVIQ